MPLPQLREAPGPYNNVLLNGERRTSYKVILAILCLPCPNALLFVACPLPTPSYLPLVCAIFKRGHRHHGLVLARASDNRTVPQCVVLTGTGVHCCPWCSVVLCCAVPCCASSCSIGLICPPGMTKLCPISPLHTAPSEGKHSFTEKQKHRARCPHDRQMFLSLSWGTWYVTWRTKLYICITSDFLESVATFR